MPLPKVAFHNPPLRARPPSYGYDDGFAVRFTDDEVWACYADGKWREISKTESLYKVGVLTERDYLRMYGPTGCHTPGSVAGVARRADRRAVRRCAAGVTCPK